MGKTEYAFWTSGEDLSKLSEGVRRFAQKNLPAIQHRVQVVEGGEEILQVLFYHFDFPSIGYILQAGDTWRWKSIGEAS